MRSRAAEVFEAIAHGNGAGKVPGVVELKVEAQALVPQLDLAFDLYKMADYGLRPKEVGDTLATLLNGLRGSCSIMVVEHDMEFVAALAGETGRVTVLAEGSVLAEGTLDAVKRDERVIESYLGR